MVSKFLAMRKKTVLLKLWSFEVIRKFSSVIFAFLHRNQSSVEKSERWLVWACKEN